MKMINLAAIWTAVTTTVGAVIFMFNTFASAAYVDEKIAELHSTDNEIKLAQWYQLYYALFDDYEESVDEGRMQLAEEYKRQMEKWRAKICAVEPTWERC